MKIRSFCLMVLFFIAVFFPLSSMETKISMELWNRYTTELNGSTVEESEFALKRGYLRLEPQFTDNIKGRFNIDLFSDDDGLDGAGLKLKYAYIDFSKIIIPEAKFTFGLMKNYFATIYDWDYTTIQKALEDKEKVIASTDYGMGIYGYIPNGFGEYSLQIINGEGYKKTGGDIDINPAFIGNLRIIPFAGFTIGGSAYYTKSGLLNKDELLDTTLNDTTTLSYAIVTKVAFGPFYIWGEYLSKNIDGDNAMGYMIMPVLQLGRIMPIDIDIIARYDSWDKNTESTSIDDSHQRITAGFNVNILRDAKNKPLLFLQTNWERTMYEDAAKDPKDIVMIQLRWKVSHKIK